MGRMNYLAVLLTWHHPRKVRVVMDSVFHVKLCLISPRHAGLQPAASLGCDSTLRPLRLRGIEEWSPERVGARGTT